MQAMRSSIRPVVVAACAAGALLVTLPLSAAAFTPPHTATRRESALDHGHGVYRGSIPAAQLAAEIATQMGGRGRSCRPDDHASTIRGGSLMKKSVGVSLGASLHFNLWNGTPDEALKQVTLAMSATCMILHHMFCKIMERILWGCIGMEVGAGFMAPAAGRDKVARGPIGEVLKCVKSAGAELANVEADFIEACKQSLTQIARLAIGHLPVPDCDSAEEEDDTGVCDKGAHASADFGTQSGPSGIQHVYLSKAPAAATPTLVSPIHTHTHGLHSCQTPGCPTSAGRPPVISDSDLESEDCEICERSERCNPKVCFLFNLLHEFRTLLTLKNS